MDEYIKREDALDAVLFAMSGTGYQSRAISAIHDVPTADVVPKSEVARVILHDLNTEIHNKAVYPNCQGDYAFVNLKVLVGVLQNIQKKYMEDTNYENQNKT